MSKTIYVERILHNHEIAGMGIAFTSKKKAADHLRKIENETENVLGFSATDLWLTYEISGVTVQIDFQETELL